MNTSPLNEAQPTSIQELFNREPEELTDQEVTLMVTELRKQRVLWNQAEAVKASKPKRETIALGKDELDDLLKGM